MTVGSAEGLVGWRMKWVVVPQASCKGWQFCYAKIQDTSSLLCWACAVLQCCDKAGVCNKSQNHLKTQRHSPCLLQKGHPILGETSSKNNRHWEFEQEDTTVHVPLEAWDSWSCSSIPGACIYCPKGRKICWYIPWNSTSCFRKIRKIFISKSVRKLGRKRWNLKCSISFHMVIYLHCLSRVFLAVHTTYLKLF